VHIELTWDGGVAIDSIDRHLKPHVPESHELRSQIDKDTEWRFLPNHGFDGSPLVFGGSLIHQVHTRPIAQMYRFGELRNLGDDEPV
jgi:hypothetical protein